MLIKSKRGWELPESAATPESLFLDRRSLIGAAAGLAAVGLSGPASAQRAADVADPTADLYPARRNTTYTVERDLTAPEIAANYNNFYEFGTSKQVARAAQALPIRPWTVKIDGLVEKPQTIDIDALIRRMPLEERLYRFRCVEAWGMTVPWTGFPIKALLDMVQPQGSAKFMRMETFEDPKVAPGQKAVWFTWPYVEALTIDEAANDLAILVTGIYGKPVPRQHGAPLRLIVPWKYGFKSVKSIVRISFTAERPVSFWEKMQASEYGFWANVNPAVAHPRWSQATEELIGTGGRRVPTQIFNGYGEYVASLYKDRQRERLWA
ncbi:protein-methionine-sulfoxide reductase catalytic subunit MsrP [Phreatobacter stygius]|uniref:Protein-methionine-sulfoxide reductase catalytic subunit MsrP n=1 Tax=Phreatobacter stygius TaxID=1940610 RepID=A0A4D7B2F4_9HYPH|nr:protein-methionine-sulfoxide reductase catalytic subunit MsrP [Phreatobacter stygius]QCI63716.1 protein-methionine-sulfoxide reductase catalytic subunit MsrP [Phreatobacter stygius]